MCLVLAVVYGAHFYMTRGTASGEAPALSGVTLQGEAVSLDALRGRPVLVHFWASWCPVCRMEETSIQALADRHAVLTVALDDVPEAELRDYLRSHALDFPVLHDPGSELGARWGVRGVPASFVIDPGGRIAFREVGYTTGIGLRLRLWWASR